MKPPLPVFVALLLACVLGACNRAKVAAPPPNAAGQWQWSNELLGSWQLDLKADGTFQRAITDPLDPKPAVHSGRWAVTVNKVPGGFSHKNQVDDELLRNADVDEKDKTIQWSAAGTLAFFYTVPKGTTLLPGAAWNGITHSSSDNASAPVEIEIEEKHPIHTYTNTSTGQVFLDLEGKVFKTRPGNIQTEAPTAGTPAPHELKYLTVTPYPGIRFEVPATWEVVDADSADPHPIPVTTFASAPQTTKPKSGWRFNPPGQGEEAYIVVAIQPTTLSPQQMDDASEINLEHFAAGFVKGASHALDGKGFLLSPGVKAERTKIAQHTALLCTGAMVDPVDNRRSIRAYAIPVDTGTIVMACSWDTEPGNPWKPIMERASSSLRINEK
jgi:hypothetical protein